MVKTAVLLTVLATADTPDLQTVLDDMRTAQEIPGVSAVVVRDGGLIFAGGSGVADLETARPMTSDTPVYIGSVTKVLTAVLALQLIERGQFNLDEPVDGIAVHSDTVIRISHLLTHASGLEREGDFDYWFTAEFPGYGEFGRYLTNAPLRFEPGSDIHYSNVGYAALGALIENTMEKPYADVLRTHVLEPLGMTATGTPGPAPDVANGYSPPGRLMPSTERPFAGVGKRVGDRHVRMYHNARAMSPAFGIYASARDLAMLARFLLGHGGDRVLSQAMRARMRERQDSGWGLGLKIRRHLGRAVARHDGWFAAHRTHLLLNARDGIGIVVLANSDSATPKLIADALHEAVLGPAAAQR